MIQKSAEKWLKLAEEVVVEDKEPQELLDLLEKACARAPDSPLVFCKCAQLLYRFALYTSQLDYLLFAYAKLKLAECCDPSFFERNSLWRQLWGNILFHIGKKTADPDFIEMAINQYGQVNQTDAPAEFDWDCGEAWALLARHSQELSDLNQALSCFDRAEKKGISSPFFVLDRGSVYMQCAALSGDPSLAHEAIVLFRANLDCERDVIDSGSIIYKTTWVKLAEATLLRCQLTHDMAHFQEADAILKEAILATPESSDLWLDWAELFLEMGWLRRDADLIETALEKLTALKIRECDPARVALLLGRALILLGLFLENFKLIKEGSEHIEQALEKGTLNSIEALAFKELALGIYFSEEGPFERAAALLSGYLEESGSAPPILHLLYQTYQIWGLQSGQKVLLYRAIQPISRLAQLRPFSALYKNEWGVALLNLARSTSSKARAHSSILAAIDQLSLSLEIDPSVWTLYNLGCAYDLLGDLTLSEKEFEKAIDLLSQACKMRGSDFQIRYHLALSLSHLGELEGHVDCLNRAVEMFRLLAEVDKEDEMVLNSLGYTLLILSELAFDSFCQEEGEAKRIEAEKALLQAAKLGHGEAYYHLACLYSLANLCDASLNYLNKAEAAGYLFNRDDLERDEWLEEVRNTEGFQEFLLRQEI